MQFARKLGASGLLAYTAIFFAFIYLPIVLIVVYSFNADPVNMMRWSGFTLDWYRQIFGFRNAASEAALYIESTDQLIAAVRTSAIVAASTTTIATVLGTAAALAVYRFSFFGKRFYRVLLFVPMLMPDIVLGIALLIFFVGVGISLGVGTIVIGQCTFLTSYVFIIVSARLAGMDRSLENASADLGADEWTTFRRVILPQVMPGVVGGALLAFIISMDDLVITYFISGTSTQTLPIFIFGMLRRGIKPEVNAIATMMLLFSFTVAAIGLYLQRRKR